ncbi:MAG: rhomboid family intramembrane serine protease [Chitinophagales bacterium]|jgi:membrane associated rhomboid family serine protease|nr:rhomboid family intramembrane serine protease [Sphingobacteriales bacterium]
MNNLTPTVKNLIIINVVLFLAGFMLPELFPNIGFRLNEKLALYYFSHPYFQPYQFFTHFFMHASIAHLAFNMISLFSIGSLLERYWGAKRVLNFYLICGLGASFFYMAIQAVMVWNEIGHFIPSNEELDVVGHIVGTPAVGASGAVFGLFAAVALLFPNSEFFVFFIPFPIKAKYLLIAAVTISIILGLANFQGDNVAHFAHLGGIITGYVLTKYINKDKRRFY